MLSTNILFCILTGVDTSSSCLLGKNNSKYDRLSNWLLRN